MTEPNNPQRRRIPVPAASRRTHLLAACLLWSTTGLLLAGFGVSLIAGADSVLAVLILLIAGLAGLLKARFFLRRAAGRIADRIELRGDDRCLGGFLSWKTWLFALTMSLLGRILRASSLPQLLRSGLLTSVGIALILGSMVLWSRWFGMRNGDQGERL